MQKSLFVSLAFAGTLLVSPSASAQFADAVVSYTSGTGFQPGATTPASALGEPSRVTIDFFGGPVDPFNPAYLDSQLVSLGTGGSLTVRFNSPILNDPGHAFGLDFNIYGNAGFVVTNEFDLNTFTWVGTPRTDGSLFGADTTSTRVSVSADGVLFYTLNPLLAPVLDNLFPTDGLGDFAAPVNPMLNATSFAGQDLQGIRSLYNSAGGGRGYDLSWAVDGLGQSVSLSSVLFVRVEVLNGNAELDGFAIVPEPASATLLLSSAFLISVTRRRK